MRNAMVVMLVFMVVAAPSVTPSVCWAKPIGADPPAENGCLPQDCGLNGAWLGENIRFRTLHVLPKTGQGAPNKQGIRIADFTDNQGNHLEMRVIKDRLVGLLHNRAVSVANATITLVRQSACLGARCTSGQETFKLKITKIHSDVRFWTACSPRDSDPVCRSAPAATYTYEFAVTNGSGRLLQFCKPGLAGDNHELVGSAVIFIGDVYDDDHGVVVRSIDATTPAHKLLPGEHDLFNIACFGTAISKEAFFRHDAASVVPGYHTTVEQRETLLRLLAGDYCGTGSSFTEYGHPLKIDINHPPFHPIDGVGLQGAHSVDALWSAGSSGASCVDTPRLGDTPGFVKSLFLAHVQECKPTIQTFCDPQLVSKVVNGTPLGPQDFGGNYAISANGF